MYGIKIGTLALTKKLGKKIHNSERNRKRKNKKPLMILNQSISGHKNYFVSCSNLHVGHITSYIWARKLPPVKSVFKRMFTIAKTLVNLQKHVSLSNRYPNVKIIRLPKRNYFTGVFHEKPKKYYLKGGNVAVVPTLNNNIIAAGSYNTTKQFPQEKSNVNDHLHRPKRKFYVKQKDGKFVKYKNNRYLSGESKQMYKKPTAQITGYKNNNTQDILDNHDEIL